MGGQVALNVPTEARKPSGLLNIQEIDEFHTVRFYNVESGSEVDIKLNPPQWEAFKAYRECQGVYYITMGGGVRAGKTFFNSGFMPFYLSVKYPGNVGIIARNTFGEIEELILEQVLRKYFLDPILTEDLWHYDAKHHRLEFAPTLGGSVIKFQNIRDSQNRKINLNKAMMGIGIGWYSVDQSEFISEVDFNTFAGRMSLKGVPKRVGLLNFNPRGHDWNWKNFVNPATKLRNSVCIQTKTQDNSENIAEDYLENIKGMHKAWVSRWVDGSFEAFEGLIYPMWDERTHVVPPIHKDMLKKHKVYVSIDYGLNNPTSIGFWIMLDGGFILRFDEYYERGLFIPDVYKAIYKILTERWGLERMTGYSVIDRSILHKRDSNRGTTASMLFGQLDKEHRNFGLIPYPSQGEVLVGINRMGAYLMKDPNLKNPFTKEEGSPRMFISQNCEKFRWEISQYQWADTINTDVDVESSPDFKNMKEEPLKKNDHAMDDARYFVMTLPPPAVTGALKSIHVKQKYLSEVTKY